MARAASMSDSTQTHSTKTTYDERQYKCLGSVKHPEYGTVPCSELPPPGKRFCTKHEHNRQAIVLPGCEGRVPGE